VGAPPAPPPRHLRNDGSSPRPPPAARRALPRRPTAADASAGAPQVSLLILSALFAGGADNINQARAPRQRRRVLTRRRSTVGTWVGATVGRGGAF